MTKFEMEKKRFDNVNQSLKINNFIALIQGPKKSAELNECTCFLIEDITISFPILIERDISAYNLKLKFLDRVSEAFRVPNNRIYKRKQKI